MSTSIPISYLNILPTPITSSDFIPVVQSASLTTYRVPVSGLSNFISSSVQASSSLTSISASYAAVAGLALNYNKVITVTSPVSTTIGNAVPICTAINQNSPGVSNASILASLIVGGQSTSTCKTYIISLTGDSPGWTRPTLPPTGWFTVLPIVAGTPYSSGQTTPNVPGQTPIIDFELEISKSYIYNTDFRIRTSLYNPIIPTTPTASLTLFFLEGSNLSSSVIPAPSYTEVASSNNLPIWPGGFVQIRDYLLTLSGSVAMNGTLTVPIVSGSIYGTASWAQNTIAATSASWASSSFKSLTATSASWASGSFVSTSSSYASSSFSSSYSITSSFATSASLAQNAISAAWAPTIASAQLVRAFGSIFMLSASHYNTLVLSPHCYNLASIAASPSGIVGTAETWQVGAGFTGMGRLHVSLPGIPFIITFTNPLPSAYYTVINSYYGYEPYGYESIQTFLTPVGQTTTGFTMSFWGGDNSNGEGKYIGTFIVLHP